jgi:isoleucyl-tRNA synthetase
MEKPAYSLLDRWLLSELNSLVRDVTTAYENYDVPNATRPLQEFVEKLSTWYCGESRRRFWKSESDSDKHAAYSTLYAALTTLSKLLAQPCLSWPKKYIRTLSVHLTRLRLNPFTSLTGPNLIRL